MNLSDWREEYNKYKLDESSLLHNPIDLFKNWFEKAIEDTNDEPNAMVLTTCSQTMPSSRMVLLKEIKENKFVFYSNYKSRKAQEIALNPNVSLLFYWYKSQRQIRIYGKAIKGTREESSKYFDSRPLNSKIAAIASPQSEETSIEKLLGTVNQIAQQEILECPEHWGAYHVDPLEMEFWQGQPARLHDRILYKKRENNWEWSRLAP